MGVSAGTFIYISTVEIIVEEFSFTAHKYKKFLFLNFGIVLMSLVWVIEQVEDIKD
jgi:solute carrier family 39 (zinc transporter), member 1/2/3